MFDLLWDLHQQRRINELDGKADASSRKATDVQEQTRELEDRVDRLMLINHAMWSLLSQATGLTEQHLLDRIREIDLRDGVEDGKVTRGATHCQKCARPLHARHRRCLYCGHAILSGGAFEAL